MVIDMCVPESADDPSHISIRLATHLKPTRSTGSGLWGFWSVFDDDHKVCPKYFQAEQGPCEHMPNGTVWLFSGDPRQRASWVGNIILWGGPTFEFDSHHMFGQGRIFKPRNP